MKPAVARREPSKKNIMEINTLRVRLSRWGKELMDKYVPLNPPRTDGTQLELNINLWEAFCKGNRDNMIRLVKAGANPHSIDRRIYRKELGHPL